MGKTMGSRTKRKKIHYHGNVGKKGYWLKIWKNIIYQNILKIMEYSVLLMLYIVISILY
jgi:hypothetical protein